MHTIRRRGILLIFLQNDILTSTGQSSVIKQAPAREVPARTKPGPDNAGHGKDLQRSSPKRLSLLLLTIIFEASRSVLESLHRSTFLYTGEWMQRRTGTSIDELESVRCFFNTTNPSVPIAPVYLKQAVAVTFRGDNGQLLAQYLIKRGPGLRYLSFIPRGYQQRADVHNGSACEITAFWMSSELPRGQRFIVYWWMQIDLYRLGRADWVLVGTQHLRLRERNRFTYSHEIYAGDNCIDGERWYIDGYPRRWLPLKVLFVGMPRMLWLQMFRSRKKTGHTLAAWRRISS